MGKLITIIVPTYNERDNVALLIERVHTALSRFNYQLLFIDDDSKDGTADLARSFSKEFPVDVVVRKDKRGLASAVVDGLSYAKGEIIGVIDADLQHPPEVLPELIGKINDGADVVIASRYVKGGGCEGWGLTRRIISKIAVSIAHLLLPSVRQVKDPMTGFFMFRREVVDNAHLNPTGFKILLEILVEGKYQTIAEVPFMFKTRGMGESKLTSRQQIDYLRHVYSLMKRSGELLRFIKFIAVGFSGIVVNEGLLWLLVTFNGMPPSLASPIAIEASIISNFLLNNFFTFSDRRSKTLWGTINNLLRFNLVTIVGLGLNWGILWIFSDILGVHYLIANLFGIAAAALTNYFLSNHWAWELKRVKTTAQNLE